LAVSEKQIGHLTDSVEFVTAKGTGAALVPIIADSPGGVGRALNFNERFECKNEGRLSGSPGTAAFFFNILMARPRCQGDLQHDDFYFLNCGA